MRTLSIISAILVGILAFSSCDKSEYGPVMSSNPGAPSFTAPESGQGYTLNEEQADDTLLTMEWSEPDYGFAAAPNFTIEMDSVGADFTNPIQFATVTGTSFSITVGDMNGKLLGAGFPPGEETSLEFRVIAAISDSLEQQVSEPITLSFTPYSICQYCPEIYVPGGYQAASGYDGDWDPSVAPALATLDDQDQYEGYVYMANASNEFKFTADRNWSLNWGDNGADGSLEEIGANISAGMGYYKINVDLNAMSYTILDTDWGLIGSATADGWNSDQDMTYDQANKVWTITADLVAGEIKFRANDAWDINYGDDGGDGTLELNGANIVIGSAGNYTVELDLSGGEYTYSVTQN